MFSPCSCGPQHCLWQAEALSGKIWDSCIIVLFIPVKLEDLFSCKGWCPSRFNFGTHFIFCVHLLPSFLTYADDAQMYLPVRVTHRAMLRSLLSTNVMSKATKHHIILIFAALFWFPLYFKFTAFLCELCINQCIGLHVLSVSAVRLKTEDDTAFSFSALKLWDKLPEEIRSAEWVTSFKSLLTTHFDYHRTFTDCVWFLWIDWFFVFFGGGGGG